MKFVKLMLMLSVLATHSFAYAGIWTFLFGSEPEPETKPKYSRATYGGNRINKPVDVAARCVNAFQQESSCEEERLKGLERGCINQEEYNSLKQAGSYPVCDWEQEGVRMLRSWCPCGCFHPDTLISAFDRNQNDNIEANASDITFNHNGFEVYHLDESSSLKNFSFKKTGVRVPTFGPEEHPLIVISTADGKALKLTQTHPVLIADGSMIQAKDLKETDQLLNWDGAAVGIQKIDHEEFKGNVVNFMIDSDISNKSEHIIFAEGLAVGDLAWQSSLEDELNKIALRQ